MMRKFGSGPVAHGSPSPESFFAPTAQEAESKAIYFNAGFQVTETLRLSGGLRYTDDDKDAYVNINNGLIIESNSRDWDDTSWEIAAVWDFPQPWLPMIAGTMAVSVQLASPWIHPRNRPRV